MDEDPLALLLEYLDASLQPAFILRLPYTKSESKRKEQEVVLVHANPALRRLEYLHAEVVEQTQRTPNALGLGANVADRLQTDSNTFTVPFCGASWAVTIVGRRWLIAVSTEQHQGRDENRDAEALQTLQSTRPAAIVREASSDARAFINRPTALANSNGQRPPLGAVKPHGNLGDLKYLEWMRRYDWTSSPVGPIDNWPAELRHICEFALATSEPINIIWGSECTFLYNQAYSVVVGEKHPRAMGRPFKENFDRWPEYYRILDRMRESGQSVQQEKIRRMLVRGGHLEEVFFDFLLAPILAADGSVAGLTTRVHDATRQVIFEQRMQILTDTNKAIAITYTVHDLCAAAAGVLDNYKSDVHFAAIYSTDLNNHTLDLILEATAGMSKENTGISQTSNPETSQFGLHHAILRACKTRKPIILSTSDGSMSQTTLDLLEEYGVQPCREVVIHPLKCFVEDNIAAVMIVGMSPLRKFDEDYRSFLRLLTRQIEDGITVVRGIAREKELHKVQITSELERRFWRFAENAPVGMYMYNSNDVLTFWNTAFEDICGTPGRELTEPMAWVNTIHPDGVANMTAVWESYTQSRREETITFEVQFKKPWTSQGDGAEAMLDRTYALGILQPEYSEDGKLKGTLGCITDISSVKWAEKMQSARLSEAIEQRRQQENFLDVTSHEMSMYSQLFVPSVH